MKIKKVSRKQAIELLPSIVKEHFSDTWIKNLSNREIEELLRIPESELKEMIALIAEASSDNVDVDIEPEPVDEPDPTTSKASEIDFRAELIAELKSQLGNEPEE